MDIQNVKWEHYPYVAAQSAARSFIERLTLKGKRPKPLMRTHEPLKIFLHTFQA